MADLVQWNGTLISLRITCASNITHPTADDGMMYGSRHQYSGGSSNQFCLKNAAGDQGGVRQGGQDSNDLMVPVRKEHSGYNGIPSSLNNILRSRDGYNIPCAKCKYAKSCFMEVGVAECPSGYHKMYTGYVHGQHISHRGNQNRICLDKNPVSDTCEFVLPGDVKHASCTRLVRVEAATVRVSHRPCRFGAEAGQPVA